VNSVYIGCGVDDSVGVVGRTGSGSDGLVGSGDTGTGAGSGLGD